MNLFNIGGEGQLYVGAIVGAAAAIALGNTWAPLSIAAMVVAGAAGGAAFALIPGVLRAFLSTNEIITSLMLNYVAALVLNYLIFDSLSYWRDTSTPDARVFPQGKTLPDAASWPVVDLFGLAVPLGFLLAAGVAIVGRGPLRPHAVRVRGEGDRRLAAGGDLRGDQDAPEDPRRDGPLGCDRRHRRRKPGRRLPPHPRSARALGLGLRLHGDRDRRARALQPARRRARRVPARRAPERRVHAAGRRLPVGARGRHAGPDPLLHARRRGADPQPDPARAARRGRRPRRRRPRREQLDPRRRPRLGGRLRHAAPLCRPRRAAGRAVGGPEPRRRGDDAGRRRDGLLGRAADSRLRPGRAGRGGRRRGGRRRGDGADPCLPGRHPAREPDRLRARADDLRRRGRALVLPRQRPEPRRPAGDAPVHRVPAGELARRDRDRADPPRPDRARLRLLGPRRDRDPLPGPHAARVERARRRRGARRGRRDGDQRRRLPVRAHARRRCARRRRRRHVLARPDPAVGRRPDAGRRLDRHRPGHLRLLAARRCVSSARTSSAPSRDCRSRCRRGASRSRRSSSRRFHT